ncbi:MAG: hypothetical protein D4S01_00755, partial [Dehalococcoidia bacterium]
IILYIEEIIKIIIKNSPDGTIIVDRMTDLINYVHSYEQEPRATEIITKIIKRLKSVGPDVIFLFGERQYSRKPDGYTNALDVLVDRIIYASDNSDQPLVICRLPEEI